MQPTEVGFINDHDWVQVSLVAGQQVTDGPHRLAVAAPFYPHSRDPGQLTLIAQAAAPSVAARPG
jgi:hypothetical protein